MKMTRRRLAILGTVLAIAAVGVGAGVADATIHRRSGEPDAEEHEDVRMAPNSSTGSCGVERWSVKTGTDADAGKINLSSVSSTTIASLDAIPAPSSLPSNNRVSPTETTVYRVSATLTQYKLEADSDYHLVLSDGSGHTMIAEIPDPACVGSGSVLSSQITNSRREFDAKYTATGSFQTANTPVTVTGVGFFDFDHGQTGVAPNAIELHATTDIQFGTGGGGGNIVTVTNPGSQTGTVGTATSLQLQASDSASGQTLTYSATGLPAGLSISSSTGKISGTPTTAASYSVTVTAKDTTGAAGSTSFSWTIGATGGGCSGQLLGNPGFETGTAPPWNSTSDVINNSTTEKPHSGSWDAWLDGYGAVTTDTLSQTVTIPAGCTASFSFYMHIDTAETTTTSKYDTLKLQVLNTSGTVLSSLYTYSNLNANTGYSQHTFNVSSYAGQTITLKFTGTEDSQKQTSFVLDDTALTLS